MKRSIALLLTSAMLFTACSQNTASNGTAATAEATKAETAAEASTTPETVPEGQETAYQADVVVIGAGGAGMAAAIEAADQGASVVILEKMGFAGGNTVRSEGGMNATETVYQKEKGIADTKAAMIEDTVKGGKELNDKELVTYFVENSAPTIDWLTSIGMDVSDVAQGAGASFARMHRPADGSKIGSVLVPILMKNLDDRGIKILYSTKATELLTKDGKITGVTAEDKEGDKLTFQADSVVIATGGFGANEELYVKYRSDLKGFATTNQPGATGDGIKMAEAVGAATVDMDQIQTNPTVEVTSNTVISESVRGKGAIFVNQSGLRFTCEMLTRDVLSKAILEQEEKIAYLIFDQAVMDSMKALQENYDKGIITKGESLAELAEDLSIESDALEATIAKWNRAVASKKDEEFKRETGMDADISRAPFYAIKVAPAVHYTMGGIKINTNAQVINTEEKVILGLYAAGEVTGGLHGGNRLGGNAVADIMIFGRQAGIQAASYSLENGGISVVLPTDITETTKRVQGDYKDGTYKGSAKGNNGDITLQVVVSGGSITEITVVDSQETEAIFAAVERDLIPEIIKTQNTQLDAVSGATVSSRAVIEAVTNALSTAK